MGDAKRTLDYPSARPYRRRPIVRPVLEVLGAAFLIALGGVLGCFVTLPTVRTVHVWIAATRSPRPDYDQLLRVDWLLVCAVTALSLLLLSKGVAMMVQAVAELWEKPVPRWTHRFR